MNFFPISALYGSSHLRGKVDDEWNSFNATVISGFVFQSFKKNPWTFMNYFLFVGLTTNLVKQCYLKNWPLMDEETAIKQRTIGFISGPYLFDWSLVKERPPKWINADDLSEEERAKVKIAAQ